MGGRAAGKKEEEGKGLGNWSGSWSLTWLFKSQSC